MDRFWNWLDNMILMDEYKPRGLIMRWVYRLVLYPLADLYNRVNGC